MTEGQIVYTIPEFCKRYRISRCHLYNLWHQGKGPSVARAGRKIRISAEAAERWFSNISQIEWYPEK